ncbi:MAG: hypothetical protein JST22_02650 [Bacteroidetes bacterium]|nr:hypothetical protein [Bacteroidota bacterium]
MSRTAYIVDGRRFETPAQRAAEFTGVLRLTMPWNGNLDAFNDFLHGGFGTPEEAFVPVWCNADRSRELLGCETTLRWLEERLLACHPLNVPRFQESIAAAQPAAGEILHHLIIMACSVPEDERTYSPAVSSTTTRRQTDLRSVPRHIFRDHPLVESEFIWNNNAGLAMFSASADLYDTIYASLKGYDAEAGRIVSILSVVPFGSAVFFNLPGTTASRRRAYKEPGPRL